MQYVWQHRLWMPADMVTVDGEPLEVLDPGLINHDAGPDFFNAKIKIGDRLWVGNVEIHVRASDWHRHGHDGDPAYNSVILHVVERDDARISLRDGEEIPQLIMPCSANFSQVYHAMVNNPLSELPCATIISNLPQLYISDWCTSLAFARLQDKADRVLHTLEQSNGDWLQSVYIILSRALGFNTNSDAFERLAHRLPLKLLLKHRDSRTTVEGALLGCAGLIDTLPPSQHTERLKEEYEFFSHKYNLPPTTPLRWKMARMRPQNFPHRRIEALAAMICDGFTVANKIFNTSTEEEARNLFANTTLSKASVTSLIINVVIPCLYAYGTYMGTQEMCEQAVEMLQSLPAEDNVYVRLFVQAGIKCEDAFTSQALIQLRRAYCESRKCLYCRIGHRYFAQCAIRRTKTNKAPSHEGTLQRFN